MKDKSDDECSGILPEPLQVGRCRICTECRGWFALVFVSERSSELQGSIATYRCRKCEAVVEFAEHHPPDAV